MQYPKWLYHRTEKPLIVNNADEQAVLGEGWEESPAAFDAETPAPPAPPAAPAADDAQSSPAADAPLTPQQKAAATRARKAAEAAEAGDKE